MPRSERNKKYDVVFLRNIFIGLTALFVFTGLLYIINPTDCTKIIFEKTINMVGFLGSLVFGIFIGLTSK